MLDSGCNSLNMVMGVPSDHEWKMFLRPRATFYSEQPFRDHMSVRGTERSKSEQSNNCEFYQKANFYTDSHTSHCPPARQERGIVQPEKNIWGGGEIGLVTWREESKQKRQIFVYLMGSQTPKWEVQKKHLDNWKIQNF